MGLRSTRHVMWDCDVKNCNNTGQSDSEWSLPPNWSKFTLEAAMENPDCNCSCHILENGDDEEAYEKFVENNHDVYDCEKCPDEDNMWDTVLCVSCTRTTMATYGLPRIEVSL